MASENQNRQTQRAQEHCFHFAMKSLLLSGGLVVDHAFDNFHDLLAFRESKSFLPEPGLFVADDEHIEMRLLGVDELAQFLEGKFDALFITSQKVPAGFGLKLFRIRVQRGRRVDGWIDADRNEARVFAETIAECFLHLLQVAVEGQTTTLTRCEE